MPAAPNITGAPHDTRSLRARYQDNLPRHLIGIARHLQTRLMHDLTERRGYGSLRLSYGAFLSLIWEAGRPISAIAEELAISKQACSQIANRIEQAGYLERRENPDDGRSKVVVLTRRGKALVAHGAELISGADTQYADLVGTSRYHAFTATLLDLYQEVRASTRIHPTAGSDHRRSIGLLPMIVEWMQRTLMELASAQGHAGLKMSHAQVLLLIGPDGGHIYEMARIQRVSRQAISAISQDLEAHGYLQRTQNQSDRRGVVLTLTAQGEALIADSVSAVDQLEADLSCKIGAAALESMKQVAAEIYHTLGLEAEVFGPTRDPQTTPEIEALAKRLRKELGSGNAAQLAELLDHTARRPTP